MKIAPGKKLTFTGFEPMTSAISVQCSGKCARMLNMFLRDVNHPLIFSFHLKAEDHFHEYDPLRTGNVSPSDFKKVFTDAFQDLLTDEQVEEILSFYRDHDNPEVCNWSKFLHDAETGNLFC